MSKNLVIFVKPMEFFYLSMQINCKKIFTDQFLCVTLSLTSEINPYFCIENAVLHCS